MFVIRTMVHSKSIVRRSCGSYGSLTNVLPCKRNPPEANQGIANPLLKACWPSEWHIRIAYLIKIINIHTIYHVLQDIVTTYSIKKSYKNKQEIYMNIFETSFFYIQNIKGLTVWKGAFIFPKSAGMSTSQKLFFINNTVRSYCSTFTIGTGLYKQTGLNHLPDMPDPFFPSTFDGYF